MSCRRRQWLVVYLVFGLRQGCAQERAARRGDPRRRAAPPRGQPTKEPAHRQGGPRKRPAVKPPSPSMSRRPPVRNIQRREHATQRWPLVEAAASNKSKLWPKRPPRNLHLLHIPKTAGATLEHLLGRREKMRPNVAKDGACVFWHTPPRFLKPNPFEKERTFCVIREPLDRLLSEFKMKHARTLNSSNAAIAFMKSIISQASQFTNPVMVSKNCHLWPQHFYVWDERGKCTCQHVLRFEHLEYDFDALMLSLGSTLRMHDDSFKQQHHQSSKLTIDDIPDDVAQQVRATYSKDMVLFGYGDAHGNLAKFRREAYVRAGDPARTCVDLGPESLAFTTSPRPQATHTAEDQHLPPQNTTYFDMIVASRLNTSDQNSSNLVSVVAIEAPQTFVWINESSTNDIANILISTSSEANTSHLARQLLMSPSRARCLRD